MDAKIVHINIFTTNMASVSVFMSRVTQDWASVLLVAQITPTLEKTHQSLSPKSSPEELQPKMDDSGRVILAKLNVFTIMS